MDAHSYPFSRPDAARRKQRGSVLVVAVLLGTGIALALGSFIALAVESLKLSNRSFFANSTLNLAEAGLEIAILSANRSEWGGWSTHSSGADNKFLQISDLDLGQGSVGEIKVVVYDHSTSPNPRIVAEGTAFPTMGPAITKQIEVTLQRRSFFAAGLISKDALTFSGGNTSVDSYNSDDPDFSNAGLYEQTKRRDRGSAGSISVTADAVSIANADIWGYVATGGSPPRAGPNGTILGRNSPSGVKIDSDRIATDFSANFTPVAAPSSYDAIFGNLSGAMTLGTAGTATTIKIASYTNTGGSTLDVAGDLTLVVITFVDIQGLLTVPVNSSLKIYVEGDLDAKGSSLRNSSGLPRNLVIYGTNATAGGQTIALSGSIDLQAAIYAPNAHVEMKGGGSSGNMSGSIIGHSIKITGNFAFHYDEALGKFEGGNPFAVSTWRELVTPAEREVF